MRRLRRAVIRCARLAGPTLGFTTVVLLAGLGFHAARDWHRHGEISSGFFHLHFHVGEHEHDHPGDDDHHRHNTPDDDKHERPAVLTVAQALDNTSNGASPVASPDVRPDRAPAALVNLTRSTEMRAFAKPRAPPV